MMPVIAGLSIGIGMIVVIALIFSAPVSPIVTPKTIATVYEPTYRVNLTIAGMKDTYRVGVPITFAVRVDGYGYYCQTPNAAIWKADEAFASIPIWRSGLPSILCLNPIYQYIHDVYQYGEDREIIIKEPGTYVLGARMSGDPAVQKEFTIIR